MLVKDSVKTPQPSQYDAESTHPTPSVTGSVEAFRTQDEGLQTINLSSDEDDDLTLTTQREEEEDLMEDEYATGLGTSHQFERRADKFKRSSLKKVDSLKKAFSRQSIEKKMNQITTKIVPPEKREKIKKSFTPNHPKSPTAKTSSFKVSPMTFKVKKVRDTEVSSQDVPSPGEDAHVEIPPIGSLDGKIPLAEVHTHEDAPEEFHEVQSPDSTSGSLKVELAINGEAPSSECKINGESSAGLAVPEHDEDIGQDEEEEAEEEKEEKHKTPVETAEDAQIPTATVAVNQVS